MQPFMLIEFFDGDDNIIINISNISSIIPYGDGIQITMASGINHVVLSVSFKEISERLSPWISHKTGQ